MNAAGAAEEMMAFPASTAAAVAQVPERRLKRWAERELVTPSIVRDTGKRRRVHVYSFEDLVEVLVVRELERAGVHIRVIGSVVRFIREHGHHLPSIRFAVGDIKRNQIYYQLPDGSWYDGKKPHGQAVMERTLDLEHIRVEVRNAGSRRYGRPGAVQRQRGKLGGKPVFDGTRVPVATVQNYLRAGYDVERILAAFPQLTPDDVAEARRLMDAA